MLVLKNERTQEIKASSIRKKNKAQVHPEPFSYVYQILTLGQVRLLKVDNKPSLSPGQEGCLNSPLYLLVTLSNNEDVVQVDEHLDPLIHEVCNN